MQIKDPNQIDHKTKNIKVHHFYQTFWFWLLSFTTIIMLSLGLIIYRNYKKTLTWQTGLFETSQADVPPEFARNIYSLNTSKDITRLSKLNTTLERIQKDGKITKDNIDQAKQAVHDGEKIIEKYKIKGGNSYKTLQLLRLYLKADKFLSTAYNHPNVQMVNDLIGSLSKQEMKNKTKITEYYLAKNSTIASDYNKLNSFSKTAIDTLGTNNHGIITVKSNIKQNDITSLLDKSNNNTLLKFNGIRNFRKIILSASMDKILRKNQSQKRKDAWESYKKAFDAIVPSDYIKVGDIKTLADANKLNATIYGNSERSSYKIKDDSDVTKVIYKGTTLSDDEYIKKDLAISVVIDPDYEKLPDQNKDDKESDKDNQSQKDDKKQTSDTNENNKNDESDDESTTTSTSNDSESSQMSSSDETSQTSNSTNDNNTEIGDNNESISN